jgi:hypothetical protein
LIEIFSQLHWWQGLMFKCRKPKLLMKGWILNVVKFSVRCGSHNHSYLYLNLWRHQLSRKVPRKVHVFIPRSKAPTSLLGVIKVVHQTPFFCQNSRHYRYSFGDHV